MAIRRRKNHNRRVVLWLLPCIATTSWFLPPVHGATVGTKSRGATDHDEESLVFQLQPSSSSSSSSTMTPSGKRTPSQQPLSDKYVLRMPDHVVTLSKRARSMKVDTRNLLVDPFWEVYDDEEDVPPIVSKANPPKKGQPIRTNTVSLPRVNLLLNGGLVVLAAVASTVSTKESIFFTKPLKELVVSVSSALTLVWIPLLLVHGGWMEFVSGVLFLSHPTSRHFVTRTLIPKIFGTLKKLLLTELWKTIWAIVLAPLPRPLFLVPPDHAIMQIQWLPDYLKERFLYFRDKIDAFILSTFKGYVQKSVYSTFDVFYDSVAGTAMEVSLYEEDAAAAASSSSSDDSDDSIETTDAVEEDAGDVSDDDSDDDETSQEPQVVCDGDVCWLE